MAEHGILHSVEKEWRPGLRQLRGDDLVALPGSDQDQPRC